MERQSITKPNLAEIVQQPIKTIDAWLKGWENPDRKALSNIKRAYSGFARCRLLTNEELAENNERERQRKSQAKDDTLTNHLLTDAMVTGEDVTAPVQESTPEPAPASSTETINDAVVRLRGSNKISRATLAAILSESGTVWTESMIMRIESGGGVSPEKRESLIMLWPEIAHCQWTPSAKGSGRSGDEASSAPRPWTTISVEQYKQRIEKCKRLLLEVILRDGRITSREGWALASANEISERACDEARIALHLTLVREGFGKNMVGYWAPTAMTPKSLTELDMQSALEVPQETSTTIDDNEIAADDQDELDMKRRSRGDVEKEEEDFLRTTLEMPAIPGVAVSESTSSLFDDSEDNVPIGATGKPKLREAHVTRYLARAAQRSPLRLPTNVLVRERVPKHKNGQGVTNIESTRYVLSHAVTRFSERLLSLASNPPSYTVSQAATLLDSLVEQAFQHHTFEHFDRDGEPVKVAAIPSPIEGHIVLALVQKNRFKWEHQAEEEITTVLTVDMMMSKFDPHVRVNQPFRALADLALRIGSSDAPPSPEKDRPTLTLVPDPEPEASPIPTPAPTAIVSPAPNEVRRPDVGKTIRRPTMSSGTIDFSLPSNQKPADLLGSPQTKIPSPISPPPKNEPTDLLNTSSPPLAKFFPQEILSDNPAEIGAALGLAMKERKARKERERAAQAQLELEQRGVAEMDAQIARLRAHLDHLTELE